MAFSISKFQWVILVVVAGMGVTSSLFLFQTTRNKEREVIEGAFRIHAYQNMAAIEEAFRDEIQLINSVVAFFYASDFVTQKEFSTFSKSLLAQQVSIKGIGWNPCVSKEQRIELERTTNEQGFPEYQVTERAEDGRMVRAGERERYVVVHYLEPLKGNEAAYGYDIYSEPIRRAALQRAEKTGQPAATARIRLVQDKGTQYSILLCAPIFNHPGYSSIISGNTLLNGYVVGIIRIGDVVDKALQHLRTTGLHLQLVDKSAPPGEGWLYDYGDPPERSQEKPLATSTFSLAGRTWELQSTRIHNPMGWAWPTTPLLLLFGGLLFTILFVVYLLRLMQFNQQLANEISEKQKAEGELLLAHEKLEQRVRKRTLELENKTEELQALAMELALTEEREKRRLAINLHDQIGQTLSFIQMKLPDIYSGNSTEARALELERCLDLIRQTQQKVRSIESDLSPSILYDLGFEDAAHWLTERTEKEHGFQVTFEKDAHPKPLKEASRLILFRSLREILFNIVKHARASSVHVSIRRDQENIVLVINDNGVGFDVDTALAHRTKEGGLGLVSIREQISRINGTMDIQSVVGSGTTFKLTAPLNIS